MGYLDIDFTAPIALLVGAIAGVMIVRMTVARGDRLAKERTQRLLRDHGDD